MPSGQARWPRCVVSPFPRSVENESLTSLDLWNGIKKMGSEQLNKTLDILEWSRTSHPEKHKTDLDETAVRSLLRASLVRSLGKFDEAHKILKTEILNHDK